MKKLVIGCMTAALSISMMAGMTCMADQTALERIKESGKLVMATDATWPPFEYMKGEEVVGVDAAIAAEVAADLGVELEIINVAFDSLSMYLQSGEADVALAAITMTEERGEVMEFSEAYTDSCQYIIVKKDNEEVDSLNDLAGFIIGAHLGTTGDYMAQDEVNMGVLAGTGASVQQYKDLSVASMGLSAGDVQAIICDKLLAENLCEENDDLKCFEACYEDGPVEAEQYGVAANKGETDLIAEVNKTIERLKAEGTIDQFILDFSADAATINAEE